MKTTNSNDNKHISDNKRMCTVITYLYYYKC